MFFFFWYVLALLKAHGDVDCREAVPTVMHGKSLRPLSVWDACDACHMHNLHDSQCLEMQALQPLSCGQRLDDAVKEVPRHGVKAGTPSRAERCVPPCEVSRFVFGKTRIIDRGAYLCGLCSAFSPTQDQARDSALCMLLSPHGSTVEPYV